MTRSRISSGYGIRRFGPYRGAVLQHRYEAFWLLVAWTLLAGFYWVTRPDRVWLQGWWLFWHLPDKALWGAVFSLSPAVLVWVLFPLAIATFARGAEGYVRFPADDRFRWALLTWLTGAACLVSVIIAPAATVELYRSDLRAIITWASGLLITVSGLTLGWRFVSALLRKGVKEGKEIRRFPDDLRPLNTKVINLDVGGLAPTLDVVSRGLTLWARAVGGSAPTSMGLWQALIDPRASLPQPWQRSLKGLALRTVEDFRAAVAQFVGGVRTEAVMFLTSTTRALDAVLESAPYEAIITTNCEHSSEQLLFASQHKKRGTEIVTVDLLDMMSRGAVYSEFVPRVIDETRRFARPAIVVSEVPFCYGIRLPVAELAQELRKISREAILIIDGAHVAGHCPLDLSACDFDYYAFSGHKWLFGPPSLGILVLGRAPALDLNQLETLRAECYESLAFAGSKIGEAGSTIALEPFVGLAEFLEKMLPEDARTEILQNIRDIRFLFEARLQNARAVRLVTYPNIVGDRLAAGIVNVQAKRGDLGIAGLTNVRKLLEDRHQIVVKVVERPASLRICLPFYLTLAEVDRVIQALDDSFAAI